MRDTGAVSTAGRFFFLLSTPQLQVHLYLHVHRRNAVHLRRHHAAAVGVSEAAAIALFCLDFNF